MIFLALLGMHMLRVAAPLRPSIALQHHLNWFLEYLGFTRLADDWPLDDKLLHFLCMGTATFFFYWIVDVDEYVRHLNYNL